MQNEIINWTYDPVEREMREGQRSERVFAAWAKRMQETGQITAVRDYTGPLTPTKREWQSKHIDLVMVDARTAGASSIEIKDNPWLQHPWGGFTFEIVRYYNIPEMPPVVLGWSNTTLADYIAYVCRPLREIHFVPVSNLHDGMRAYSAEADFEPRLCKRYREYKTEWVPIPRKYLAGRVMIVRYDPAELGIEEEEWTL